MRRVASFAGAAKKAFSSIQRDPRNIARAFTLDGHRAFWRSARLLSLHALAEKVLMTARPQSRDLVQSLYLGILRRNPDPGGLATYCAQLESGVPLADIIKSLLRSDEFRTSLARFEVPFINERSQNGEVAKFLALV